MGLKILHSADWHLGAAFSGFSQEQRQFLIGEQKKLPGKIADLAREHRCDLVLLAGDLLDTPAPGGMWTDLLKQALEAVVVPVFIAPGNHDYCCPGSPWLEEKWPGNVHVFTGGLESVSLPGLDCKVWGAGYKSMDCPHLLENFRAEGQEAYKIGVLHGCCTQTNSPYCPVTSQQIGNSDFCYLALGHLHKGGILRKNGTFCGWPGCPMGRGWDETGEKGVLLVNLEKDAEITPVLLDTPRFYDLELEESELFDALPPVGNADFYRITLTGEEKSELWQLREKLASFPNLFLRDRREAAIDLWADVGEDSLRGVYFTLLQERNAPLTAEISHRILRGKEVSL